MSTASDRFGAALRDIFFFRTLYNAVFELTRPHYSGDLLLSCPADKQIVRWQAIVEHMISRGADTFVELGPGKTLCV